MLAQILQPIPLVLLVVITIYTLVLLFLLKRLKANKAVATTSIAKANKAVAVNLSHSNYADEAMRLNQTFRKFVPKQFVDHFAKHGSDTLELGRADEDELAILFTDIRGFTGLSENMTPQELMNFLNSYFLRMNDPIHQNNGFIDKFIGDAVMALFDRPTGTNADKAQDAIRAALGLRAAIVLYNSHRAKCHYPAVNIGIGVHFGPVIIGTVGSEDRMDTTVIGDTVNIAYRLETLAPKYFTDIVVSEETLKQADAEGVFVYRILDWVRVKGRQTPIAIYEVIDHQDEAVKELKLANAHYIELGITYRKQQKWDLATEQFTLAHDVNPQDPLVTHHLQQCELLKNSQLDPDWDGSIRF
ncbi:adenylate/guanylate cyclase domain-containing protein [Paraglaciecola sp. 2405UD69-4]|uniref:adenylate/guanylate cyclase domain-containing protein n=1 Tax=Paraglaciecola sp. 2405UD69-4 TaxID=3391836 RepID=UPI0039C90A7B